MGLKERMAADAAMFLNSDDFAEYVHYNGVEIPAVIEIGEDRGRGNTFVDDGQSARAVLWVSRADVPNPQHGDEVTHDKTWRVARILSSDPAMHQLELIADEAVRW